MYQIPAICDLEHANGKKQFQKLQSAYIDARYRDYSITGDELSKLEQQVKIFIGVFKTFKPITSQIESDSVPTA